MLKTIQTHFSMKVYTRCSDELTADLPGAVRAVIHGAGVGPSLSVGCCLPVPALWGAEGRERSHEKSEHVDHHSTSAFLICL